MDMKGTLKTVTWVPGYRVRGDSVDDFYLVSSADFSRNFHLTVQYRSVIDADSDDLSPLEYTTKLVPI